MLPIRSSSVSEVRSAGMWGGKVSAVLISHAFHRVTIASGAAFPRNLRAFLRAARAKGAGATRRPQKAKTASPCGAGGSGILSGSSLTGSLRQRPGKEEEPKSEGAVHGQARPAAFNHAGRGSGKSGD
jgi:hypothetical protein